jgi:methionine-S-sulfoxide reductase
MTNRILRLALAAAAFSLLTIPACRSSKTSQSNGDSSNAKAESESPTSASSAEGSSTSSTDQQPNPEWADKTVCDEGQSAATFAAGCFWCVEKPYDNLEGVKKTIVGYAGGTTPDPTYDQVAGGKTDHAEAIQICYDDSKVTYDTLLKVFWRLINPTQENGQFVDIGSQYRTAVFYHNDAQKSAAGASKQDLANNGPFDDPIVTTIQAYTGFWKAKDYHQNFYKTHPERYHSYHSNSGRYPFYKKYWDAKNPTEDITADGDSK